MRALVALGGNAADPAFSGLAKAVGRYLPRAEAEPLRAPGQAWEDRGPRGCRRVVPSPEPMEIGDATAVEALVAANVVAMGTGGGGAPVVGDPDGTLREEVVRIGVTDLRGHAAAGESASASMGPQAVITSPSRITEAVTGFHRHGRRTRRSSRDER
jgi:carbamate kinase